MNHLKPKPPDVLIPVGHLLTEFANETGVPFDFAWVGAATYQAVMENI